MSAVVESPPRPVGSESETEAPPETEAQPRRERSRLLARTPWPRGRTRNGAPTNDEELIVDNATFAAWQVSVGYRDLGVVAPQQRLRERVVKSGLLSARPLDAPVGTPYLTAYLRPAVRRVEIRSRVLSNEPFYDLRLVEGAE